MKQKVISLAWSSGKDSAWALQVLTRESSCSIRNLFTTVTTPDRQVAMHAVPGTLLQEQALAIGLPLVTIELPWTCPNVFYEKALSSHFRAEAEAGIEAIAFGDLFLKEIRDYRQHLLAGTGLEALFPLWDLPTSALARTMLDAGLQAVVVCVDPSRLDASFAGRAYDRDFLRDLPEGVDPCGENGEFHTFVWNASYFQRPVAVRSLAPVQRDGFVFAPLEPACLGAPSAPGC